MRRENAKQARPAPNMILLRLGRSTGEGSTGLLLESCETVGCGEALIGAGLSSSNRVCCSLTGGAELVRENSEVNHDILSSLHQTS